MIPEKNIFKTRDIDQVVVLGSGMSINNLTPGELDYINRCKVVIALNKFAAFYKQSGIIPTHVYFVDIHENNLRFLQHVFDVCRADKLKGVEFILDDRLFGHLFKQKRKTESLRKIIAQLYWHLRRFVLAPSFRHAKDVLSYIKNRMWPPLKSLYPPENCSYTFIRTTQWDKGGAWGHDFIHPLFHFRGSLTTVLNYITIKYPNRDVYLVGTDFNGSEYFFQKELEQLEFDWTDFTTAIIKESGKHFSATEYRGTTMFDQLGFILSEMNKAGNAVFCTNPSSELVTRGGVLCKPLPVQDPCS